MHATRWAISDVMRHTSIAVGREASYKDVVELMHQWQVSALPVLEGEGHVVGVVSEADLLPRRSSGGTIRDLRLGGGPQAGAVLAEDLMSSPTVTVHPDATIAENRPHHGQEGREAAAGGQCHRPATGPCQP
ncbi:CBS domain-containing protein [Streptomyces sp. NPDC093093]|uniref:CBS domain-containing protein n=1 Tax=Streptomyces sp. NPDC093093 TaxID=3366025 RepID=UPI00380DA6AB